jgi:1,4-dihydroxy-2-naphthoate octaprenyltransferase
MAPFGVENDDIGPKTPISVVFLPISEELNMAQLQPQIRVADNLGFVVLHFCGDLSGCALSGNVYRHFGEEPFRPGAMFCNIQSGTQSLPLLGSKIMSQIQSDTTSPASAWLLATRPKTLPAAVAPVIVASALAYADHGFSLLPAMAALSVALLMQIGVNLANDYFDFKKGIDTEDRLGPIRVTQSGLIPPARVKTTMLIIFVMTLLPGFYLVARCGWPAVIIGGASILAALAYSGGPYPLASHALGDLCVFVFFGLVAVCGTYYVQTLELRSMVVLLGVVEGFLITAILAVNNLRDIRTDRRAGKRTLAVMIGDRGARLEYTALQVGAYTLPAIFWLDAQSSVWILLPTLSLPLAIRLNRIVWKTQAGPALNHSLAGTAKLTLMFSVLLSIGLILSK